MVIGGRAGVENVENPGCQGAGLALRWAVAWMVAEHQWPWVGRPEGWWASGAEPQGMGAIGDLGRGSPGWTLSTVALDARPEGRGRRLRSQRRGVWLQVRQVGWPALGGHRWLFVAPWGW